jgi:pimeloyl-ACP methyl ester carboxylesterase
MSSFSDLPSGASLKPKPFKAHVSDQDLSDFKQLLKLSKIGPKTYENSIADVKDFTSFGITRDWLAQTKQYWETKYDWRKTEDRINGYPNFTVPIKDDDTGHTFDIHFIALFSKKADAVPVVLLHGWPGSPLEFLEALSVLMGKYTPETLPYHVVVPSLPGYAYSSTPPLDQNFNTEGIARVVDKLMIGLGFESGYITQGGDIGSFVSRVLAVTAKSCLAAHSESFSETGQQIMILLVLTSSFFLVNLFIGIQGEVEGLSETELRGVERYSQFGDLGNAYARMHGTRPGTIGLVLSSSPVALLAW